jgi:putative thiamine transport system permease protein
MARTLRRLTGLVPIGLLWGLPLLLSLIAALQGATDGASWRALFQHPQLWPGLALSLSTGLLATALALLASLVIVAGLHGSRLWTSVQGFAAAGLALPHLAFAVGFALLVMPSGLLARLFAGAPSPPQWVSVQDPSGIALTAALAAKEIPFLLAMAWSVLARADDQALAQQLRAARSLGHGKGSAFLRVALPQLLRAMTWPLAAAFLYAASVVDMAIVLGPTQPPVWQLAVWRDLNDAEPAVQARGLAGAVLLAVVLVLTVSVLMILARLAARIVRPLMSRGPSLLAAPALTSRVLGGGLVLLHAIVLLLLALMSVTARWPWPALWPEAFTALAWATLLAGSAPLWTSLALGVSTSVTALVLAVLWFEAAEARHDVVLLALAALPLAVPPVLLAAGQYRLLLELGLTGTAPGLFLVHLAPVLAYAAIVLRGPYRGFDRRYVIAARALSASPLRSLFTIKLPMLRAPLLMALAVGFAVSMVQFVPAQLIGAGRVTTLPVEAVTLASGGSRSIASVYALALALPPLLAFGLAGILGRPRWR